MAKVERSQVYEISQEDLWGTIGDFHGIHNWHPAISESKASEDGKVRSLTLADGATLIEEHVDQGDFHYTYRITESPLPLKSYEGTLLVRESGEGGSEIVWSAEFEAEGVTEDEAEELIVGIYEAGLESLKQSA